MVQDIVPNLAISGFSLVFVIFGLYTMNRGRRERAKSERIAETETTTIRDIDSGKVEVKGTARLANDGSMLESPFSREPVLASYVEVEQWESSGQHGGNWETIHEVEDAAPIIVDDGTGTVRVVLSDGGGLNLEVTETKVESNDELPENIRQYLERTENIDEANRRDIGPLSIGERRKFSEGVIEDGEEVYVLGVARDAAGWDGPDYVIDEPTESGDFLLSDRSEAELIEEGKRGGLVYLGFGAVLILAGLSGVVFPWLTA